MYLEISKIKPYQRNAKKHPEKQIKQIADSIKEFGFNQPIVIDKNNEIIVGHGRYLAAIELELKEVPVIKKEELSPQQVKAYRLADNKLNESGWSMDLVLEELKELDLSGFDIDLTGFSKDLILESIEKDNQVPEFLEEPKSKLGDVYRLGEHRLMCGDATNIEHLEMLMNDRKADMVFTDPPYGVSYADKNKALNATGRGNRIQVAIENDHKKQEEMKQFWTDVFSGLINFVKGGGSYYVCSPQGGELMMMMMSLHAAGWPVKHTIIWVKNNIVIGRCDYHYKHEPILYGWKEGSHQFFGGRKKTSVWNFDKPQSSTLHPTMKPVGLVSEAIINSSKNDDIILDVFLGSGSTLIAAEKTGRTCYGMELDPHCVDVIIKRWEDYTGQKAERLV